MNHLDSFIFKLILGTLFIFPFWNAAGNVLFGLVCLLVFVQIIRKGWKFLDKNILFWILLGLFTVCFLNEILFGDIFRKVHFWFYLGVPLVFAGFKLTKTRKRQIFTALNFGGFVMILITFAGAFQKNGVALSVFNDEFVLRQHQTIYCYFLLINIATSLRLWVKELPFPYQFIFGCNGIFSVALLFVIQSRMPMLVHILIVGSYFYYRIFVKKARDIFSKTKLYGLIFVTFLGIFYVSLSFEGTENIALRVPKNERLATTLDAERNERIYIYKALFNIFLRKDFNCITGYHTDLKSDPILKTHLEQQKKALQAKGSGLYFSTNWSTHNDFLEYLLNYGLVGLFLFVVFFVTLFQKAIARKDFDLWACGLLLFFTCLTDNPFLMQASLFIFLTLATVLFRKIEYTNHK